MKAEDFLLVQPQQDRALVKFRRMVDAGIEILAESGLAGLTTDAIAARAEVNISTFYKYFPNRDALVGYLSVTFIEEQTASLKTVIERMPADAPLSADSAAVSHPFVSGAGSTPNAPLRPSTAASGFGR